MNKILNGNECRDNLKQDLLKKINNIKDKITLTVISVGENEGSKIYIKNKMKECESVGIICEHKHFDTSTTEELISLISKLNSDRSINGILVQLPLPKSIDKTKVINTILPDKDVDGLTYINIGKLMNNENAIIPCTAKGILDLLNYYKINLVGKDVTIVGRSNLVGKPLIPLLLNENATVTICHTKTKDLKKHTKTADILIVAAGTPKLITKDMIKKDAIVIDVGINRLDGKLCGDVDFENVLPKVKYITPVPKGVGPMTVFEVLNNTIDCYNKQNK